MRKAGEKKKQNKAKQKPPKTSIVEDSKNYAVLYRNRFNAPLTDTELKSKEQKESVLTENPKQTTKLCFGEKQ